MLRPMEFLARLALLLMVASAVTEEDGVLVLDDNTFTETIKAHPFILVEFYAPWCGHCKQFAPEYAGAAKQLKQAKPAVPLAKIDATSEVKTAEEYGVRGYPTIRLFIDGRDQEYTGGRTEQSIITWVMKKVGPPAVGLEDAAAAENFEKEHQLLVIGLFEDDTQRTAFETVARQLEDVFFAYSTSPSVAAKYGMTAPAVRMLYPFDEKAADYAGDITSVADLETFVKAHRHPIVTTFTGETAAELFSDGRPILFLFRRKDDAGEKAERELQNAAITLQRKVLVSLAGDSEPMDQRLMDYITVEPEELPTVRLVANVTESMTKYKLPGNEITASALTAFVADFFEPGKLTPHYKSEEPPTSQTGPVVTVVGTTFNSIVKDTSKDVLVEFYAPWCGHCKKIEPVFRDVAKKLEGVSTLVIAKIDATANDVEGVDVEGFPTIKLWRADKKDEPVDYDGDRDVDSFISWLEEKVSIPFSQNEVKTEL